ncbi:hypothetical protein SLA2020_390110 [Shorea laevis]
MTLMLDFIPGPPQIINRGTQDQSAEVGRQGFVLPMVTTQNQDILPNEGRIINITPNIPALQIRELKLHSKKGGIESLIHSYRTSNQQHH